MLDEVTETSLQKVLTGQWGYHGYRRVAPFAVQALRHDTLCTAPFLWGAGDAKLLGKVAKAGG